MGKLNIFELSVGNYVKVNYGLGEGQIFKVKRIVNNEEGGWVDLNNEEMGEDYALGHSIKQLDPIYIKDVIDKLGFKKVADTESDIYIIHSDDFIDVTMEELTDGLYTVKIYNCEFNFPTERKHLSTIHQLQNFLIEDDIHIKI